MACLVSDYFIHTCDFELDSGVILNREILRVKLKKVKKNWCYTSMGQQNLYLKSKNTFYWRIVLVKNITIT